jgi:hypothetical protein
MICWEASDQHRNAKRRFPEMGGGVLYIMLILRLVQLEIPFVYL